MLQRHQLYSAAIFLFLSCSAYAQTQHTELIGGDIRFHGTVEALPCNVKPGGEKIGVDFKQISTKDLYANKKSSPVPFTIALENCSNAVFKTVSVTFSGVESTELPDYLVINPVSPGAASGVAIGLKEMNGSAIELNKPTTAENISRGSMNLSFQAWVEGTPTALQNKNMALGPFTATANYTLTYQ